MRRILLLCAVALLGPNSHAVAGAPYQGLEVALVGVSRGAYVDLTDCPAGGNIVHGAARPGDNSEYVSVTLRFTVKTPGKSAVTGQFSLKDAAGKTYRTAQTFSDIPAQGDFTCAFSFRTPLNTQATRLFINTTMIDLKGPT